ncbi:hypothetical protein [Nocardioides marinquilinus]|uniref:hypothetical protein n=1 Tax=Nocardioides marinquilinus TaxID=1210400 RepID=UPI0031EF2EE0
MLHMPDPRALSTGLAGVLVVGLLAAGCGGGSEEAPAPDPQVELSFTFTSDGGDGFVDQTLDITNEGDAAGATVLAYTALADDGSELPGVKVATAFGSDRGGLVVPASTQVYDVLRFTGKDARRVSDVRVEVTDPGTLEDDVPPANDIALKLFDPTGRRTQNDELARLSVRNPFDQPITVDVVGLEFPDDSSGTTGKAPAVEQFTRASLLVGPLTVEPGTTASAKVPRRYLTRFFGSVETHLTVAG